MRIAFCISGLSRTFAQTQGDLRKLVERVESLGYTVDLFARVADPTPEVLSWKWLHLDATPDIEPDPALLAKYERLGPGWNPTIPRKFLLQYRDWLTLRNMWYSECCKYDVVFRLRTDTFISGIDKPELASELENCVQYGGIYIPSGDNHHGYNDRLAFGASGSMSTYQSCYESIDRLYDEGMALHAESMLKAHLDRAGVTVRRTVLGTRTVRVDGTVLAHDPR